MYKVSKIVSTTVNGLLPPLKTSILPYCKFTQINLISSPPKPYSRPRKPYFKYPKKYPCSSPRKASISNPPIKHTSNCLQTLFQPPINLVHFQTTPRIHNLTPKIFWTLINPKTETIFVKESWSDSNF